MNLDNLFEELNVTELEDRLELTARCSCRSGGDGGDDKPIDPCTVPFNPCGNEPVPDGGTPEIERYPINQ